MTQEAIDVFEDTYTVVPDQPEVCGYLIYLKIARRRNDA